MESMRAKDRQVVSRPTRALFLTWGYSIHAERRIRLFTDDCEFDVGVVSTYDYKFSKATNYLLTGAEEGRDSVAGYEGSNRRVTLANAACFVRERIAKLKSGIRKVRCFRERRVAMAVWRLCRELIFAVRDFRILRSAIKEFVPDVIFLQTLMYPSYLAYFVSWRIPRIVTFWNGDVVWWAKWSGIERLLKKQIVAFGIRRATAITVNSTAAFNACLGYGIEKSKVHTIRYPGVDFKRFHPIGKAWARQSLGITARQVVFAPRGLAHYLNSDIIVDAASKVIAAYADTLFIFARASSGGELATRAHERGIERNIRWEGVVPWEQMPLYYCASDVVVSISSNDSTPNCMFEAMACRVPLIMGDIPQIREWVKDEVNGFLVSVRDSDALADRILGVFVNAGSVVEQIVETNYSRVRCEMDSQRNGDLIRRLVHQVARETRVGQCGQES